MASNHINKLRGMAVTGGYGGGYAFFIVKTRDWIMCNHRNHLKTSSLRGDKKTHISAPNSVCDFFLPHKYMLRAVTVVTGAKNSPNALLWLKKFCNHHGNHL